jgi:glycosyltransferase involved in cell wall biosynthesis
MRTHTLYLCYFGLREPLVQTQVLPYLRQLVGAGIEVSLLTFEPDLRQKWSTTELEEHRSQLAAEGIRWFSLPYHKRPSLPATTYDIFAGAWKASSLMRRYGINVLHARAHVPMAMAMLARRFNDCRLVFDFRGLVADEYVDAGIWRENSLAFKAVKKVERKGFRAADQIIVLTKRMREWLVERGFAPAEKIEAIPCCFDFSRFRPDNDLQKAEARFEVVYAGSVTGLYMLEEMGRFFLKLQAQQPAAFFRVLTVSSRLEAEAVLKRSGLSEKDFSVEAVPPAEVPAYLKRARLGLSFRKPTFSQMAASPTKIPEYLAAGLPVVCNSGIGDVDELLETEGVGVLVRSFDDESYLAAAERALKLASDQEVRARCAIVAREHFDLINVGGAGYRNVYHRLQEHASALKQELEAHSSTSETS